LRITENELKLGTLYMDAPAAKHTLRCVQFAYDDRHSTIVLVSVAGPQTAVKSFAAALNENCKLSVNVDGLDVQLSDGTSEPAQRWRDFERVSGQGKYKVTMHRLGFNYVQCTARLKDPRLLPAVTDESLWAQLRSNRFTTPILRTWVPWLMEAMLEEGQLEKLPSFQCQPGMLNLDVGGLDGLVSRGVTEGRLIVPGKESAT
jgi:hypothetical protein